MQISNSFEQYSAPILGKAYAVLPIYCEILASRADGFHKFQCILQQLSLYDTVTLKLTADKTVTVKHPSEKFDSHYVSDTVRAFLDRINADFGVVLSVQHSIPANGGLFDRESITATALKLINSKSSIPLSRIMLLEFANSVSNELLCCAVNGTKYVDMLDSHNCMITSLPSIKGLAMIHLTASGVSSITQEEATAIADSYYGTYWEKHREHPSPQKMLAALKENNYPAVLDEVYNIYSKPMKERFQCINEMYGVLRKLGAIQVCIAGCSNSVIGFFEDAAVARVALSKIDPLLYKAILTEAI